jgi:methylated-DNA-[protein]-cysteine S-methyltransferase
MNKRRSAAMNLNLSKVDSPLGKLLLVTDKQEQIRALDFTDHQAHLHRLLRDHYVQYELVEGPSPGRIATAFQRYFDGDLVGLDGIATATAGSELQRQVWAALRRIPVGQTTSYGELARVLGYDDPRMAIEIGAANGANPIAIVVPCHRVIARNGDLKGYAWGLHRKRWLLEHEHALPPTQPATDSPALRLPGF